MLGDRRFVGTVTGELWLLVEVRLVRVCALYQVET